MVAILPTSCTAAQRAEIARLLKRCELPVRKFTLLHRIPWRAAKLPDPPDGGGVDAHLGRLTSDQASRLIDALRAQACIDDDEDDNDAD